MKAHKSFKDKAKRSVSRFIIRTVSGAELHISLLFIFLHLSFLTPHLYSQDTIRMGWTDTTSYMYSRTFHLLVTANEPFTVNWGDGSPVDTMIGTGNTQTISRIYININYDHHITVTIAAITPNCRLLGLDCANNKLTFLEILNASEFEVLGCKNNLLTSLDIRNYTKLIYLDCQNNLLTTLDLSNNTELLDVYCRNNQLTTLNLTASAMPRQLFCENNQLSGLEFSTNMWGLYCNNNQLNTLKSHENARLGDLNCGNNRLPLSELYDISQKVNNKRYEILDTQRLHSQEVKVNELVDFSTQNEFDGIYTVFKTEKDSLPANPNDYSLNEGVFAFKDSGTYTISMTNAAITAPHEVIVDIRVLLDVKIVETENKVNLVIYPNPTYGQLRIANYELRVESVEIFDITGKHLLSFKSSPSPETEIDITHLPSGIYFIKIQTNAGTITKKVVKQ